MPVIIAAGITAAASTAGSMSGGSGGVTGAQLPPNAPTSYSQTTTLPDWYNTAQQGTAGNISDAVAHANALENPQAFEPYAGAAQETSAVAGNTIAGVSDPSLNQGVFDSYMDPYTQGVVNQIQTLGNRNLMENVLPGVNNTFTGAGQFGSDRNGDFEARAIRDNQQATSNAQAQALEAGFGTSLGAYNTGEARSLAAGQALQNQATNIGNLGEQYQREIGMGIDQTLKPAVAGAQAINGMNVPTTINGTGNAPLPGATYGPSVASQLAGAGAGLAGAIKSASGSSPTSEPATVGGQYESPLPAMEAKKGGPVRKGALRLVADNTKAKKRGGALSRAA